MKRSWRKSITALLSLALALVKPGFGSDLLKVKTDRGIVEGTLENQQSVIAFKGIPYAAPPVGLLRWREPQPAAAWNGILPAKEFRRHCIQFGGNPDVVFRDPGEDEDCLTLNVWTPSNARLGSLPVMVWIHGGGFAYGASSEPRQDGKYLAKHQVVVVSMNYRLGMLGFFAHPGLTAESPHHASGNYGLMDMAAALSWVKRNIASFGGDPANVTVFGESAGSFSVSLLMATPSCRGLFSKAIGESGGAFFSPGLLVQSREEREIRDLEYAGKTLGTTRLDQLRGLSAESLTKGRQEVTPKPIVFGPDIDGFFLPDAVPNIYAAGKQAHIPLLAGWTSDEGRNQIVLAHPKITLLSYKSMALKEFGANAPNFLVLYAARRESEVQNAAADFAGDKSIAYSTWRWLQVQTETSDAPTFRYFFTRKPPADNIHPRNLGAFHTDEIEYVFGTLDSRPGAVWRGEDRLLSTQIMDYWTNFARSGDPNGPSLRKWPRYQESDGWEVMRFDVGQGAAQDHYRARYLFLDQMWGKP